MAAESKPKNREQTNFCVDAQRLASYKREAERHKLSLSAWIRLVLDGAVKRRSL